jgi:hypothetical protein
MSHLKTSARFYTCIAVLRRQVLFRQISNRAVAGAVGVMAFTVGLGLSNVALFLALPSLLGDIVAIQS